MILRKWPLFSQWLHNSLCICVHCQQLQQCYQLTVDSQISRCTNKPEVPSRPLLAVFKISHRFCCGTITIGNLHTTVRAVTQRYSNFYTWGLSRLVERRPDGNITSHANLATSGLLKAHVTGTIVSDEDNTALRVPPPSSGTDSITWHLAPRLDRQYFSGSNKTPYGKSWARLS